MPTAFAGADFRNLLFLDLSS